MKMYYLVALLFLFMPIQSLYMDYNEGPNSEIYSVNLRNGKITATRFKKSDFFLAIKRNAQGAIVAQAKDPQRFFQKLELEYSELTDSQDDPE